MDHERYRFNDDGEPSGTAGRPIFGQIQSGKLTNLLVVVVRYFGGTLLGVSGLIQAYKQAAGDALSNAVVFTKTVEHLLEIAFEYPAMNSLMQLIKEDQLEIVSSRLLLLVDKLGNLLPQRIVDAQAGVFPFWKSIANDG